MLTTDFVAGAPNWIDLGSPDTGQAAGFYTSVLGWDFASAGPGAGGYGFFRKDGATVAALGPLTEEGVSSAWTVYFQSPDADATAKSVEKGGGTVRVAPSDVMDAGRMGCFTDPGGAEFAVWQPAGVGGLERTSEEGALCWVEAHVPDPTVEYAFYRGVFGWRAVDMEVPGLVYKVLSTAEGDQQEAAFGGMAPLLEGDRPCWIPYFCVGDPDATVVAAEVGGGSARMAPADVAGVGRIAWIEDPSGAVFAVIRPDRPAAAA
ncbi:VOC family protein [Streptomyces sp. AV19]|uniref:VOC family protein n=1 Tax=Streptomyces sp. AV19 TaxID=2793068 RepID=UPI0018FE5730|nr:VOC family protein [Streptomyces sp. AV19]MBH1933772.1 VOC family protein [Streptomyces sp. AV19]MDG4535724.1 VOC family protein [Streptomyces sp. AV19]